MPFKSAFRCTAAGFLFLALGGPTALADDAFTGTWQTERGEARIRIAPCGPQLCGFVAWLRDPLDPKTGQPPVDEFNPNPAMRSRPVLGIRIFAMSQDATGSWTGPIYNSDDGQTYRGRLAPRGHTEIEVNGCAGRLCGSEVWKRIK